MARAALLVTLLCLLEAPQSPRGLLNDVAASTDVAWLERLASDQPFADGEYASRGRNVGSPKTSRSRAYLRLGELGTPESLAAIVRIERAYQNRSTLPSRIVEHATLSHPAAHMGDSIWRIDTRTASPDGREYAAFVLDLYGSPCVFIAWRDTGGWTRPYLTTIAARPSNSVTVTSAGNGVLRITLKPGSDDRSPEVPAPQDVAVSDIVKDSDGDGWTDIEEQRLGLNPHSTDSDGDGRLDTVDATPLLAKSATADAEEAQILERAIFAAFGLTGAPHALFADEQATRIQLAASPGPVIYAPRPGVIPEVGGGIAVSWKVLERRGDEATVEITDHEAPLAASGEQIALRRINGAWYAVKRAMLWIS